METLKQRRPGDKALGFFLLCHPIPVLLHTVAVTIFAVLAAWPHLVWATLILVAVAHCLMQCSIAVLNDYCDRRLDLISKRHKPLTRGLVSPHEAFIFGLFLMLAMFLLLLPLNPLALLLSLLYLLLGQGYNLGLKSTPWSGIVFALAIPLIPIYAFVGVGHFAPFVFGLFPVAALLGVTLNLANSLPDIVEDAANQARTLAVVLGRRGTQLMCFLLMLLSVCFILFFTLTGIIVARGVIVWPTLFLVCLLIALLGGTSLQKKFQLPERDAKRFFLLVVGISFLLATGWLTGILLAG